MAVKLAKYSRRSGEIDVRLPAAKVYEANSSVGGRGSAMAESRSFFRSTAETTS